MKDIFTPKLHPKVRPNDILVKHHNTITYCTKNIRYYDMEPITRRH